MVVAGRRKEVFVPKLSLSGLQKDIYVLYMCGFMYKIYINMPDGFNSILFVTRFFLTLFPAVF